MRRALLCVLTLVLAACSERPENSTVSDFAMLARAGAGFEQATRGMAITFPADHGMHPGYRIEWWYLTANLTDGSGRDFGVQWTLFRSATRPPESESQANPWHDPQIFMAHFAITTPESHQSFQRYARGGEHEGLAQAGAQAEPFMAWLDDWSLQSSGPDWLPLSLQAGQDGWSARLSLASEAPPVLQGDEGFSQKHPEGGGSHYYSHPFLSATGVLTIDGVEIEVRGSAWLDREWSSQFLQPDQQGWDWFALHLDSGEKLMIFRLRPAEGHATGTFLHGVLIGPDGGKTPLDPNLIDLRVVATEPIAGREIPVHWRLSLGQPGRELEVRALHPDQWMAVDFPYWEGVVIAEGDDPGSSGRGYLEMTGYPVSEF